MKEDYDQSNKNMIGSFLKEYATAIGAMVSLLGLGYWVLDTEEARKLRFAHKFQSPIQPFNLKTFSYVSEPKLIEDIKGEIKATIRGEKSGVRILWGIPGSGKTTTTKAVMNELLEEKAIAGCIYIAPNENSKVGHAEIFRRYIADWRGQLLRFWRGQLWRGKLRFWDKASHGITDGHGTKFPRGFVTTKRLMKATKRSLLC